ncbi:hypothetical protein ACFVGI_000884 [Serratia marcescens]|nr:hypothetical protein [Serratia marcescens]
MKEVIGEIQEMLSSVIDVSTHKNGACLYMGALLFAMINSRYHARAKLVTGSLTLNNRIVFSHEPIQPILNSGMDFSGQWSGHAWVEVGGYIVDPSIFLTIYSPTTTLELQKLFREKFKEKCNYLIDMDENLYAKCIFYKRLEILTDKDATILINNGADLGFYDESLL